MAFEQECDARSEVTFEDYVPDIYWAMHEEYVERDLDLDALNEYNERVEWAGLVFEIESLGDK
jgi:hypothetical protein